MPVFRVEKSKGCLNPSFADEAVVPVIISA